MNCTNSTAPIDINISNITGKCDLKCKFSFNYQENNSVSVINRGDYLLLSYQNGATSPVNFNTYKYDVKEIRLYMPSLHSYNGFKTQAELVIVHNPITGTKPLLVCIPVKEGENDTPSSILLKNIINNADSIINSSININLPNFNLNLFVPRKPFFSYSGTNPYLPCGGTNDFIVYGLIDSNIYISKSTIQSLKSIIKQNGYNISQNNQLYYNELGPELTDGSDDIYIDCQPVGQSDEEILVLEDEPATKYKSSTLSFGNLLKNPNILFILQVILGSLFFVALIMIANVIFGLFNYKGKGGNIQVNNVGDLNTQSINSIN
jgi:carbonic anhydrase